MNLDYYEWLLHLVPEDERPQPRVLKIEPVHTPQELRGIVICDPEYYLKLVDYLPQDAVFESPEEVVRG